MLLSNKILKWINILVLLGIWLLIFVNFQKLPEIIPIHYNIHNEADGFGSRNMIWFLPILSTLLFLFLKYLSGKPKSPLLNVPNSMREKPVFLALFINIITFFVLLMFAEIVFEIINSAKGNPLTLGIVMPILMVALFVAIIVFHFKSNKI